MRMPADGEAADAPAADTRRAGQPSPRAAETAGVQHTEQLSSQQHLGSSGDCRRLLLGKKIPIHRQSPRGKTGSQQAFARRHGDQAAAQGELLHKRGSTRSPPFPPSSA